jgi:hypothetical protein
MGSRRLALVGTPIGLVAATPGRPIALP